jgi:hypothetical protein
MRDGQVTSGIGDDPARSCRPGRGRERAAVHELVRRRHPGRSPRSFSYALPNFGVGLPPSPSWWSIPNLEPST